MRVSKIAFAALAYHAALIAAEQADGICAGVVPVACPEWDKSTSIVGRLECLVDREVQLGQICLTESFRQVIAEKDKFNDECSQTLKDKCLSQPVEQGDEVDEHIQMNPAMRTLHCLWRLIRGNDDMRSKCKLNKEVYRRFFHRHHPCPRPPFPDHHHPHHHHHHDRNRTYPPHSGNWTHPPHSGNWTRPPHHSGNRTHPPHSGNWTHPPHSGNWTHPPHSGNWTHPPHSGNRTHPPHSGNWTRPPHHGPRPDSHDRPHPPFHPRPDDRPHPPFHPRPDDRPHPPHSRPDDRPHPPFHPRPDDRPHAPFHLEDRSDPNMNYADFTQSSLIEQEPVSPCRMPWEVSSIDHRPLCHPQVPILRRVLHVIFGVFGFGLVVGVAVRKYRARSVRTNSVVTAGEVDNESKAHLLTVRGNEKPGTPYVQMV